MEYLIWSSNQNAAYIIAAAAGLYKAQMQDVSKVSVSSIRVAGQNQSEIFAYEKEKFLADCPLVVQLGGEVKLLLAAPLMDYTVGYTEH